MGRGRSGSRAMRFIGLPFLVTEKDRIEVQGIPDALKRSAALSERNLELAKRWLATECKLLGIHRPSEIRRLFRRSRMPFSFPAKSTARAWLLGVSVKRRGSRSARQERLAPGVRNQLRRQAHELGINGELVRALNSHDPFLHWLVDLSPGRTIPRLAPPVGLEGDARWIRVSLESELFNTLNLQTHWCEHGQHWYVAGRHSQRHCFMHGNAGRQAALRARRRP